ncbi:hypothetical protein ANCCAN_29004, partial [Ancylostoma caninum]
GESFWEGSVANNCFSTKDQRATIIRAFRGHAVSLMRIVYAAEVLECAYNDFANAQQRFDIVSEFYGKQFVMFQSDTPRTLDEIVAEEPSKKKLIVQHLEEQIFTLVDKSVLCLYRMFPWYFHNIQIVSHVSSLFRTTVRL